MESEYFPYWQSLQKLRITFSSGYDNTSGTTGSSHLGRDATVGAGVLGAGEAAHHHHDRERENVGSSSDRSFPLGGNSDTTSSSGYPSTSTNTAGPHSSNLANKTDPRVDSDFDGSRTAGSTGYGSGTGPSTGSSHQGNFGRDTALGAGAVGTGGLAEHELRDRRAGSGTGTGTGTGGTGSTGIGSGTAGYGPESWQHKHDQHGHAYEGDPCGSETAVTGAPHFTTGPHVTDTANRLDPNVQSEIGAVGSTTGTGHHGHHHGHHHGNKDTTTGTGFGSTDNQSSEPRGDHRLGRDAALAGGVGSGGVGAYESSRGQSGVSSDGPSPSSTGPHGSALLNKLDPRVDSSLSKQEGSSGMTDSSATGSVKDHHYGRDAGLVGAGGAGAYEAEKHTRDRKEPATEGVSATGYSNPYSTSGVDSRVDSTSNTQTTGTTGAGKDKDHHYGRDAGLAGAGGAAAYEVEKHRNKNEPTQTSGLSGTTTSATAGTTPGATSSNTPIYDQQTGSSHHYGRDAGLAGAGGAAAYEVEKHHQNNNEPNEPTQASGISGTSSSNAPSYDQQTGTGHHYGRDAGLAGAGGAAAYEAEQHRDRHQPTAKADTSAYPSSGYDDRDRTTDRHTGRDAALVGGAGAGAGAVAGTEYSKKEAEKAQKEHMKELEREQKNIHKHEVKDEKKHEKALEKEEKKEEQQDGKKHGGLFGFLHRDKSDKDSKEEEAGRHGSGSHHGAEAAGVGAAGAGAVGLTEHEKHEHERNRLHKDPPASYGQSGGQPGDGHMTGSHIKATGGTGITAVSDEAVPGSSGTTGTGQLPDGRIIEPHTGLPMDLSKGDGAGGTDGNPIPGYHGHDGRGIGNPSNAGPGEATSNEADIAGMRGSGTTHTGPGTENY